MIIVYVVPQGGFDGIRYALESAVLYANAPVYCISRENYGIGTHIPLDEFTASARQFDADYPGGGLGSLSIQRWLVLADYMEASRAPFPVFSPDWDVMFFQDLVKAYAPFMRYEWTKMGQPANGTAAYSMNSMEPLIRCRQALEQLKTSPGSGWEDRLIRNDMSLWNVVGSEKPEAVGDLDQIIDGSTFDWSPAMDVRDVFVKDSIYNMPTKKVVWKNGKPHYVLKATGELVRLNIMHCWCWFKPQMKSILDCAKRGRTDEH